MKLNCIIVDDDPVFRLMLKELVKKDNLRLNLTGLAESAEEAQKMFKQQPVDLIFLDVGLPGMDGFEFIDALGNPPDLQIILVTGHKEHALDAFEYGIVDYLVKPISRDRFNKAVSKALRNHPRSSSPVSRENIIFKKVAQYLDSRNLSTLEPVPLRFAKLGYAYPMLTANYNYDQEEKALTLLNEAENEGLLTSTFIDSMYVCNTCSNSLLHMRETCPYCNSSNLGAEDLVHHFACAYVGPISDFYEKSDDKNMVCPKCEQTLNHIGVDYDKPSLIYSCKNCDHNFQNPEIKGKCHHCGADTKVEHLVKKEIKSYQLSKAGKQFAQDQFDVNLQDSNGLDEVMDESYLFRSLVKAVERKKSSNENSCIAELHFKNISGLYSRIGDERTAVLIRELYGIIQQDISAADEVAFINKVTARLLLTNMHVAEAKSKLKKTASRIYELIQDNFDDFEPDISIRVQAVEADKAVRQQLDVFNQDVAEA